MFTLIGFNIWGKGGILNSELVKSQKNALLFINLAF